MRGNGLGDDSRWVVGLERLDTFAWATVRNGGAAVGPNVSALSLGGGKRGVKKGEQ
jgi:hypothetical protein